MPNVPAHMANNPDLVAAVIDARRVEMETGDTPFAIEWLLEHSSMSIDSATRVLQDDTFRYPALYPEGHHGLEALRSEQRARGRRAYRLKKLRPQVVDRDESRCQGCSKRVEGRDATLDHKDPEGPETLDNVHLLCRACNSIKSKMSWEDFQAQMAQISEKQNTRPDFICRHTGLSVKGRSWREAGCESPSGCLMFTECTAGSTECPCHHYGCPPDCPGCFMCEHDGDSVPQTIHCEGAENPFESCGTPVTCRETRTCGLMPTTPRMQQNRTKSGACCGGPAA